MAKNGYLKYLHDHSQHLFSIRTEERIENRKNKNIKMKNPRKN